MSGVLMVGDSRGADRVTSRQERAAVTREHMVEAGLRLAEHTGLAGMSVNLIVEKAGVAKGTFFHHFGDRAGYLAALHREFHDRLFAEIAEKVAGLPPGRDRLLVGATAYMDGCLRHRGIRALLLEARAEPLITDAIAERNRQVIRLIAPDFAVIGWADPAEGAALWNALVVEAALRELAAGQLSQATRNALAQFLPAPAERPGAERQPA